MMSRIAFVCVTVGAVWLTFDPALAEGSRRCMSCNNATQLSECQEVADCGHGQVCFVEEEYREDRLPVVTAGCRDKTECERKGCFGEQYTHRRRREADEPGLVVDGRNMKCHHCCAGDYCNMYGCPDTSDYVPSMRCLECQQVQRPGHCDKMQTCGRHEVCLTSMIGFGSRTRFQLGCVDKRRCELLKEVQGHVRRKRADVLHSECCFSNMCNRALPLSEEQPARNSETYTCPPPQKTSSPNPTGTTTPSESSATTTPREPEVTSSTVTTTEATIKPEDCYDRLSCDVYDYVTACTGDGYAWGRFYCPAYCGHCTATTTTTVAPCSDRIDCRAYGRDYACQGEYVPWARDNCPRYCGFCTGPEPSTEKTTTEATECLDNVDCPLYGDRDYVCQEDFLPWARLNCARYCGHCAASTTMKTTTHSTKPTTQPSTKPTTQPTTKPATTPSTTTDAGCYDVLDNCVTYDLSTVCDGYRHWAFSNCRQSCSMCTTCIDDARNCADLRDTICGDSGLNTMCRATCGLCW